MCWHLFASLLASPQTGNRPGLLLLTAEEWSRQQRQKQGWHWAVHTCTQAPTNPTNNSTSTRIAGCNSLVSASPVRSDSCETADCTRSSSLTATSAARDSHSSQAHMQSLAGQRAQALSPNMYHTRHTCTSNTHTHTTRTTHTHARTHAHTWIAQWVEGSPWKRRRQQQQQRRGDEATVVGAWPLRCQFGWH